MYVCIALIFSRLLPAAHHQRGVPALSSSLQTLLPEDELGTQQHQLRRNKCLLSSRRGSSSAQNEGQCLQRKTMTASARMYVCMQSAARHLRLQQRPRDLAQASASLAMPRAGVFALSCWLIRAISIVLHASAQNEGQCLQRKTRTSGAATTAGALPPEGYSHADCGWAGTGIWSNSLYGWLLLWGELCLVLYSEMYYPCLVDIYTSLFLLESAGG